MTDTSHTPEAVLSLLARERTALLAAVDRIPAQLQGRRLITGAWSAAEVIEHVARNEWGVVRMFAAAAAGKLGPDRTLTPVGAPLPANIVASLRDRSGRWQAPQVVQPSGGDPAQSRQDLSRARLALIEAYRVATPAVLDGASYPHPYLGPMTLRAWLELVAHHDARHATQIEELAAHCGTAR